MAKAANTTTSKTAATAKPQANEALTMQLARQSTGYHFGPQELDAYDKNTNIVVAKNGVFRVVKTAIAVFTTKIAEMTEGYVVPGMPEMKEGVELLIPKIPFKYWLQPLNWYRDVQTKDGTEASVLFFWNHNNQVIPTEYEDGKAIKGVTEDGQFVIYCPVQKNSAGLSEFHNDGMVKWLREHTTPLLETHSHHTMDAYFSGTDDANENFYQFYAVYGKITQANPMFAFRFCSGKHKVQISPWTLFEKPDFRVAAQLMIDDVVYDVETPQDYSGPWPKLPYPEDWMGQHTKSWGTTTYTGYNRDPEFAYQKGKVYDHDLRGYVWPESQKKTSNAAQAASMTTGAGTGTSGTTTGGLGTKKNETKRDVIETETSRVEIVADEIVSKFTREQIIELVVHLCEYGYDFYIGEGIEELEDEAFPQ